MLGKNYKKPFEKLIFRKDECAESSKPVTPAERTREVIARRAALEFQDGMFGRLCFDFLFCFCFVICIWLFESGILVFYCRKFLLNHLLVVHFLLLRL